MEQLEFTATENEAGVRIDRCLSDKYEELSRSYLQKLLKEQGVTVNGKAVKANYKIQAGDLVQTTLPDLTEPDILPENIPLDILYEDDDVLVINKPKGMVVHPANGHTSGTLVNAIMYHCQGNLSGINGVMRPGIVHRIDKDTTGALLVCKNDTAHRDLAQQLRARTIKRRYRAIVAGNLKEDEGTVEGPIGSHPIDRKNMAINYKNGKAAVTHYNVLERFGNATYIECRLETGRTHQIRVHMASHGKPHLGESQYCLSDISNPFSRSSLHALKLKFQLPFSIDEAASATRASMHHDKNAKKEISLEAPLPEDFKKFYETIF